MPMHRFVQQMIQLDDAEGDFIEELIIRRLLKRRRAPRQRRKRMQTSMAGGVYVNLLLGSKNDVWVLQVLRIKHDTFMALRDWLLQNTTLQSSKYVSVKKKLAIFLHIVSRPASSRDTQERLNRSGETIHRYFQEVLNALLELHKHYVTLPTDDEPLASRIGDNPKFYPFFEDCLGAIDGTHIPLHVPANDQMRYRNRKGFCSHNVLAACNFDMRFRYVLSGWEGSVHDGRVLQDAQAAKGFRTPKGKYWLGDAGYGCTEFVLAPYRGVRYHLREQQAAGQTPENAPELFNLRHSSLRNVIERVFGVLKRKFNILGSVAEYPVHTQFQLVPALTGLANFLTAHKDMSLPQDEGNVNQQPVSEMTRLRSMFVE